MNMPRWLTWKRAESVVTVALLLFVAYRVWPQISVVTGIGGTVGSAPHFQVTTLQGDTLSTESLRGQVVLVNFWASWCGPCRFEMPGFQKLYEDKHDQGFTIVGISQDRGSLAPMYEFLQKHDIDYPIARGTGQVDLAFGGVTALPTSFLIDRNGVIRHKVFGFFAPPALRVAVNRLLAEEVTAAEVTGAEETQ